jgi:hypothetical protein
LGGEERALEGQDYFLMLKRMEKSNLVKAVGHKFEYLRSKYFS